MKKITLLGILLIGFACSRQVIRTPNEVRVLRTGTLMEMNSEDFLVSNNSWNLKTTRHFKFYFDQSISQEFREKIMNAQETNFSEIAKLMGMDENLVDKIKFWVFKDREQKKLITLVDSDAHAISTFPSVYYLPKNATGGQEVGHVMTQVYWGFIPKTSNYSLVIDEGFNYYIDDDRFYDGKLFQYAKEVKKERNELSIQKLITLNKGEKIEGVDSGSHNQDKSFLAGGFVKYLIETYGVEEFGKLWRLAVENPTAKTEIFKQVYGKDLQEINGEFENKLEAGS